MPVNSVFQGQFAQVDGLARTCDAKVLTSTEPYIFSELSGLVLCILQFSRPENIVPPTL